MAFRELRLDELILVAGGDDVDGDGVEDQEIVVTGRRQRETEDDSAWLSFWSSNGGGGSEQDPRLHEAAADDSLPGAWYEDDDGDGVWNISDRFPGANDNITIKMPDGSVRAFVGEFEGQKIWGSYVDGKFDGNFFEMKITGGTSEVGGNLYDFGDTTNSTVNYEWVPWAG